jgi:hypothetical protein
VDEDVGSDACETLGEVVVFVSVSTCSAAGGVAAVRFVAV